ncbi:hypothetical protein DFH11DRAFT_100840, partial [Phellopilus nigrolimitatus]
TSLSASETSYEPKEHETNDISVLQSTPKKLKAPLVCLGDRDPHTVFVEDLQSWHRTQNTGEALISPRGIVLNRLAIGALADAVSRGPCVSPSFSSMLLSPSPSFSSSKTLSSSRTIKPLSGGSSSFLTSSKSLRAASVAESSRYDAPSSDHFLRLSSEAIGLDKKSTPYARQMRTTWPNPGVVDKAKAKIHPSEADAAKRTTASSMPEGSSPSMQASGRAVGATSLRLSGCRKRSRKNRAASFPFPISPDTTPSEATQMPTQLRRSMMRRARESSIPLDAVLSPVSPSVTRRLAIPASSATSRCEHPRNNRVERVTRPNAADYAPSTAYGFLEIQSATSLPRARTQSGRLDAFERREGKGTCYVSSDHLYRNWPSQLPRAANQTFESALSRKGVPKSRSMRPLAG